MNHGRQHQQDNRVLWRIVALLASFAGLAARLANAPQPVRVAVLFLLRTADAQVSRFLFGEDGEVLPPFTKQGDTPDDALLLAHRFADLAEALHDMLVWEEFGPDIEVKDVPSAVEHSLTAKVPRPLLTARFGRLTATATGPP